MSVRPAQVADIMRVLEVAEAAKKKSRYTDFEIDDLYARKFMAKAVHTHEFSNFGGTFFLVCETDGIVEGYILGFLDKVYQIGKKLVAVETHFYTTDKASPRDALQMLNSFIAWGEENEKVLDIFMSTSDFGGDIDARYEELLKRKGFKPCGTNFAKRVSHKVLEEA